MSVLLNSKKQNIKVEKSVHAVLFDLDGTLLDTGALIASSFRYATCKVLRKVIPDKELLKLVGQPLTVQMEKISPVYHEELISVYLEHNHAHHDSMIKEFSGVKNMLVNFKEQGLKLGVVTSKRHALAVHGLDLFGYTPLFDSILGSDDVEKPKPDPYPILLGAECVGVSSENCLYVGDSPYDIQAGNAAGTRTVAVDWGMFAIEELRLNNPFYEISHPAELVGLVDTLQNKSSC